MFFFRRKEVVVDCFTADPAAFEGAKPRTANTAIPDWWKRLKAPDQDVMNPQTNMRYCSGFIDLYRTGFVLPLWSELNLEVGPVENPYYAWQFSDQHSGIVTHPEMQWGGFTSSKQTQHFKINSPWLLKTKVSLKFLASELKWNTIQFDNLSILPGVVDFKYQPATHVQVVVRRTNEPQRLHLPLGLPLYHFAPLTEKKVKLKSYLVDYSEIQKKFWYTFNSTSFVGRYYTNKRIINQQKTKCPFAKIKEFK